MIARDASQSTFAPGSNKNQNNTLTLAASQFGSGRTRMWSKAAIRAPSGLALPSFSLRRSRNFARPALKLSGNGSDLSIELGVPLDYQCDIYQRALDKIAATAAKHGIAAGMYFIPPEMDPNFFVQKGFKFFTMPWGPWAKAGIQNGLAGIKR